MSSVCSCCILLMLDLNVNFLLTYLTQSESNLGLKSVVLSVYCFWIRWYWSKPNRNLKILFVWPSLLNYGYIGEKSEYWQKQHFANMISFSSLIQFGKTYFIADLLSAFGLIVQVFIFWSETLYPGKHHSKWQQLGYNTSNALYAVKWLLIDE